MFKIVLESYIQGECLGNVAIATEMTEEQAQDRLNELANNLEESMKKSIERFVRTDNALAVFFKENYLGEKHYSIQIM